MKGKLNYAFVCIVKLLNGNVFGEEVLGIKEVINGETLIL